jgi:hypothetical protein
VEKAPNSILLLKDGGGLRPSKEPVILLGEEDGMIEVANVDERGLLKIKH